MAENSLDLVPLGKRYAGLIKTKQKGGVGLEIQRDSKSLYGLNSKRHLNTRQTVGCGIPSSLLALPVDLRGLRSKLS